MLCCYFCLRPTVAVETGVANGKSSSFLLNALKKNGQGRLISIDLPTFEKDEESVSRVALIPDQKKTGWLVPEQLRELWELRLGDARELLPQLKSEISQIDYFQHDSLHTYDHMKFELDMALEWVSPEGLIGCDDITTNKAFEESVTDKNVDLAAWIALFDVPNITGQPIISNSLTRANVQRCRLRFLSLLKIRLSAFFKR